MPLCWHSPPPGRSYLFHYTTPARARQIVNDGVFQVGKGALYGSGLYATPLAPDAVPPEDLLRRLFFGLWPPESVNGVVVLVGNDDEQPFEAKTRDIWLLPGGPAIEIENLAVGVGIRTSKGWVFDSSLYV
jgi:hypothetical protein